MIGDDDVISLTIDNVTSLTDDKVTLLIAIDDDDNFTSLSDNSFTSLSYIEIKMKQILNRSINYKLPVVSVITSLHLLGSVHSSFE